MWRSRSLEEWEAKKSYLIRSLFEDVSIPASIFKGHESASLSLPSNFIYRAESPLPELIIELEPKKPNLHDDPEELYDALAKEMRRLYRKDFLEVEFSTSSSENSSSESFKRENGNVTSDEPDSDEALDENGLKEKCQTEYDATEHQIDNDTDSLQTDKSTSKNTSETTHIASESLILQLNVHLQEYEIQENLPRGQQGFTESKQYRLSGEYSRNVSKITNVIESIYCGDDDTVERSDSESLDIHSQQYQFQENLCEQQDFTESKQYRLSEDSPNKSIRIHQCGDDDTEERSDSESFAKDTDASKTDSTSNSSINSSHAVPEIMRQRQPFVSSETPPHPVHIRTDVSQLNSTFSKTIHLSMEVGSKEDSEDVLTSNQGIEIAEGSDNETIMFVTSTPTRKRTSRFSMERGQKRRLVSYSSSSLFASVANAASQTSFYDSETDWCNFWSNFFVGMPRVYNVCSCNEHVCST